MASPEGSIPITALPPQELARLREQLEGELSHLSQSFLALQRVASSFGAAGQAIEKLGQQKAGEVFAGGARVVFAQTSHRSSIQAFLSVPDPVLSVLHEPCACCSCALSFEC